MTQNAKDIVPRAGVSRTALTAAAARGAHLIVDGDPVIFADTLAAALLGDRAEELLAYHRTAGTHPVLVGARSEAVCRSRYAEDQLRRSGLSQYVILGAGLDTFAYRTELTPGTCVFEVDEPATQQWKRAALDTAGIAIPDEVTFVPVDFETDDLLTALTAAGFDRERAAFVSWLGVTMYLTRSALAEAAAAIGSLSCGTQLVADYLLAPDLRDDAGRFYAEAVGPVAAESGEPWLASYAPEELTAILVGLGFATVEHLRQVDAIDVALWERTDALRPIDLSGLVLATV